MAGVKGSTTTTYMTAQSFLAEDRHKSREIFGTTQVNNHTPSGF